MSQLQTQKNALETRRAQQRANVAAAPNDRTAADALRQTDSELATVNAQIIYGPGARAVIGRDIGLAAVASRRPQPRDVAPTARQSAPTPAPMQAPDRPASSRLPFVSESDVPWPQANARQFAPQPDAAPMPTAQATAPANAPQSALTADARPDADTSRRYGFQGESDVPWPDAKPAAANAIFRGNGSR